MHTDFTLFGSNLTGGGPEPRRSVLGRTESVAAVAPCDHIQMICHRASEVFAMAHKVELDQMVSQ